MTIMGSRGAEIGRQWSSGYDFPSDPQATGRKEEDEGEGKGLLGMDWAFET